MTENICSKCGQRPAYSRDGRTFALCAVCGEEALETLFEEVDDDDGEPDFTLDDEDFFEHSEDCPGFCDFACNSPALGEPEFIGVELEPGVVAHVSPNVQPETLDALKEMMRIVKDQFDPPASPTPSTQCPRCGSRVIFPATHPRFKHQCHICEFKWRDASNGGEK